MMIKLQIDKRTVVLVSAYAPHQDLTTDQKDLFYESIIQLIASISKKGMHGYHWWWLKGHVGKKYMDMTVFIWSTRGKHILEMSYLEWVLDMTVCDTWFKKIDMKVIPSEEVVSQNHIVDVKILCKNKALQSTKTAFYSIEGLEIEWTWC